MPTKSVIYPKSIDSDRYGNNFPDVMAVDLSDLKFSQNPYEYKVTINDIKRFDILIETTYGSADYVDIILMINNIGHPFELTIGQYIKLPILSDIQSFYRRNLQ